MRLVALVLEGGGAQSHRSIGSEFKEDKRRVGDIQALERIPWGNTNAVKSLKVGTGPGLGYPAGWGYNCSFTNEREVRRTLEALFQLHPHQPKTEVLFGSASEPPYSPSL